MSRKFVIVLVDISGTATDTIHENGKVIPEQTPMVPGG
jgi:hypothetical protein